MHALIIWQMLNARHEDVESGRFTQKFLIVAPGLIVYDRLLDAFCGRKKRDEEYRDPQTNDYYMNQEHYLLRTIVIAERLGVHQHRTGCRSIKPSQVQYSFRLAGSQEIPGSICPSLYPGVVIIGMCPAWGINLACRNADCSQGSYRKGTLLTAAAVSRTDG